MNDKARIEVPALSSSYTAYGGRRGRERDGEMKRERERENICFLLNLHVEIFTPKVMVLEAQPS